MYQKIVPMFLVEDVDAALLWYQETFGAKLQHNLPRNPPFEWVSLLISDIEIMFSRKKSAQKWYSDKVNVCEKPTNFISYIYVKDTAYLYDRIKDKVTIVMQPRDQWYGIREFAIQDPFGFMLIFAQIIG